MSQKLQRRTLEQGTASKTHLVADAKIIPQLPHRGNCSLCQESQGLHRRSTTRGTKFYVCEPCDVRLNLSPISRVIAFCDAVDRKAGAR